MTAVAPVTLQDVMPETSGEASAVKIAVVVPLNFPDFTEETRELVIRFTRTALTALADSGAALQVIDVSRPDSTGLDDDVAGVLLLGGGDVDPDLYGHRGDVPNLYGVERGCDERTLALIKAAVDTGRPLLGVCRGSQLINVAFGGTLIPDLGPENPHRGHGDDPMFLDDTVLVEPDTRLVGIVGEQRLTVRNGHHQAVGDVAPDLTVAARGLDGVVEAIEHRDRNCWVFGVQWHPEDADGPALSRDALFGALLEQAAAYQSTCRTG